MKILIRIQEEKKKFDVLKGLMFSVQNWRLPLDLRLLL
jgi:hypothetical protein